ncbi:MAG TPA: CPBP family intramembrane glutamic endopeptidase [Rhodothermia bacterium]
MTTAARNRGSDWRSYFEVTRSGTYGFLAALPLWAAYEVLILMANSARLGEIRVSADIWIKRVLSSFGAAGMFGLGLAVLIAGIAVFYWERKKNLPIRPRYLFIMPLESAVYAVALGWFVGTAIGIVFAMAPPQMAQIDGPTQLALSLGAGLYEELVFRVLLVGVLFWLLRKFSDRSVAYLSAALIGAAIFSAVHYVGPFGDPFTISSFAFRFLFGLMLNGLYILRGFGVVAWTHALYDVSIVVGLWG